MMFPLQTLERRLMLSLTPVGGETVITGGVVDPVVDVAVADDGNSHIVVTELRRGDVRHITAFRYAASGALLGAPITLYRYVQDGPALLWSDVSVAMDADGDAVVAYAVDDGDDGGLFFNRISRTGQVAPTVKVAAGQEMSVHSPSVTMNNGGQFYLGWIAERDAYDEAMIRAYGVDGTVRGPEYVAERTVGLAQFGTFGSIELLVQPFSSIAVFAVTLNATGDVGPTARSIYYGLLNTTGNYSPQRQIEGSGDEHSPTLALAPNSAFALGYVGQTSADDARPVMRAQLISSSSGNPVGITDNFDTSIAGSGLRAPELAFMPSIRGFGAVFVGAGEDAHRMYATQYVSQGGGGAQGGFAVVDTEPPFGTDEFSDGKFVPAFEADAAENGVVAYVERSTNSVRVRRLRHTVGDLRGGDLFINGNDGPNHIIVERVRENLFVNVDGIVQRFNASAVQFLSISGLGGNDDIVNGTGLPSTIHGGDGADTIWGGVGPDRIRGFGGNDSLRGGDGDDILFGDDDNDTLHGGNGRDTLRGGLGQDALLFGEVVDPEPANVSIDANGVVLVEGTDGVDNVNASSDGQIVVVDVNGLAKSFAFAAVKLIDVRGHGGRDQLIMLNLAIPSRLDGGADGDLLRGGVRGDLIRGGNGDDTMYGGRGEDTLSGGAGNDFYFGESANDTFQTDTPGGRDTFDGGSEFDTLDYSARTNPVSIQTQNGPDGEDGEGDHANNVEILIGGSGDDLITPSGSLIGGYTVIGGAGDDTIRTGSRDDSLSGGDGDDEIRGGDGNDTVSGGAGNDSLFGEAGNDALAGNEDDDYFEGGAGNDVLDGGPGADTLFGLAGNDRFIADDGAADTVRGGDGTDEADADGEDDVIAETVT